MAWPRHSSRSFCTLRCALCLQALSETYSGRSNNNLRLTVAVHHCMSELSKLLERPLPGGYEEKTECEVRAEADNVKNFYNVNLTHTQARQTKQRPVWLLTAPDCTWLHRTDCRTTPDHTRPHRTIWSIFRITNDPCSSISTLLATPQFVPYIMLHLFSLYCVIVVCSYPQPTHNRLSSYKEHYSTICVYSGTYKVNDAIRHRANYPQ